MNFYREFLTVALPLMSVCLAVFSLLTFIAGNTGEATYTLVLACFGMLASMVRDDE